MSCSVALLVGGTVNTCRAALADDTYCRWVDRQEVGGWG